MNLKDRGITVGDLLILVIIIISATTLVNTFNKDKKTTINLKNGPPNTYIRFWAAKPGDHPYKSFKQAYSLNNKTEKMPNAKYENGGMVKTNNKGNCKL